MPDNHGQNEGFRVLDEFVCQAILDPALAKSALEPGAVGRGANQGTRLLPEAVLPAGSPESREDARQRKESLPRRLICAIFFERARELGKRLPVSLGDIDLGDQGAEATARVVSRFLMARAMDFLRQSEARNTFLIDLAILMTEIARPESVFRAEARQTAINVADRLLRWEGWRPASSALADWKEQSLAINPTDARAAKEYLALLRRNWGWVGPTTQQGNDEEAFARAIVIPEPILIGLTKRCT